MGLSWRLFGAITCAAGLLAGCLRSTAFHCTDDPSCGAGGRCEATGYCSITDPSCPSGSRYSDTAGSPFGGQCVGGGSGSDAGSGSDGSGGNHCYGTGLENICLTNPAPTLMLSGSIDTDTEPTCLAAYPTVCAIGATDVTVSSVVATGSRPLVIVAAGTLSITGTLDASSKRGGSAGAGSRACATNTGTNNATGGGGGAGGTFGGRGGNGGNGDNQNNNVAGGMSSAVTAPTMLVGGCGGSAGGTGGAAGGAGGAAGGALYLIAGGQLQIQGNVLASGAGGAGGSSNSGGGGGGTGGMIGLDAPTVTIAGSVIANGGGGGGGASNGGGNAGSPGADGTMTTTQATGGAGGGGSSSGGTGAAGATLTGGTAAASQNGGGGGGGGAGVIRVFPAQSLGGTISPPPS